MEKIFIFIFSLFVLISSIFIFCMESNNQWFGPLTIRGASMAFILYAAFILASLWRSK